MSEKTELSLLEKSLLAPEVEKEAKMLLLAQIYKEVVAAYKESSGRASNGGRLADLPECVVKYAKGQNAEPCPEDMAFSYNAIRVMMARYISRDAKGRMVETPAMVMRRVAEGFAGAVDKERLYRLLIERKFIFNSPTLFNMYADGARGALSACYVTPIYDDMAKIMEAAYVQALTFKYGGGQGFTFGNLRPRGAIVKGTGSTSSGPLSFMRILDAVTESVKQGGKRRGANMGIMPVWHPDIYTPGFDPLGGYKGTLPAPEHVFHRRVQELINAVEEQGFVVADDIKTIAGAGARDPEEAGFIQAKEGILGDAFLTNFNISVAANDAFMQAAVQGKQWTMVAPNLTPETTGTGDYRLMYTISRATGAGRTLRLLEEGAVTDNPFLNTFEDVISEAVKAAKQVGADLARKNPLAWQAGAAEILDKIVENAWKSADPGMFYIDNHNKWSPTPWLGVVTATNPCVSGDTRVLTPRGWLTAKEIWESANAGSGQVRAVLVDESALGEGGERVAYETRLVTPTRFASYRTRQGNTPTLAAQPVEAWVWHVGRKPGLRVVTEEGFEVTVTHEHKFLTPDGWKAAEELEPGDKIAPSLIHPDYAGHALQDAAHLDPDIAFAIGWLLADGDLTEERVEWVFRPGDEAAMNRVKRAIAKLGGMPDDAIATLGQSQVIAFDSSSPVYKGVNRLVGGPLPVSLTERRVPELVWRLGARSLAAFLRALFTADGTVDGDANVRLWNVNRELLGDVQLLLTTFGIYSRIRGSGANYELVIDGAGRAVFADVIGFETSGVDGRVVRLREISAGPAKLWLTVSKVEYVGEVDFYDFSVPGYNRYIAAGLIHHNCGEQPLYPFESCNLGSMSVEKYVVDGKFKLAEFLDDVAFVVGAMDAVIDLNLQPDPRQTVANKFTRKIGLGVMGLADALARIGFAYDSEEAVAFTLILMAALEVAAWRRSWELGAERGPAPAFDCEAYDWYNMRCLKPAEDRDRLVGALTPALVRTAEIAEWRDGWLVVHPHRLHLPEAVLARLARTVADRVRNDGAVYLVRREVVERVARDVFGLDLGAGADGQDVLSLVALAVVNPAEAWRRLAEYGKSLGASAPRNTVTTTIAPTGTISILAGTSSGIEPFFALVYKRYVTVGVLTEVIPTFKRDLLDWARRHAIPDETVLEIFETISKSKGSLRWALPKLLDLDLPVAAKTDLIRLADKYATSMDFDLWYHLAHQGAAQLYVDQAISKTINLPNSANINDVYTVFVTGWLLGLKGVTVYRDESKTLQVISFGAGTADTRQPVLQPRPKRRLRMTHLRKRMTSNDLQRDPELAKRFSVKTAPVGAGNPNSSADEVVVELDENSTCKTCHL